MQCVAALVIGAGIVCALVGVPYIVVLLLGLGLGARKWHLRYCMGVLHEGLAESESACERKECELRKEPSESRAMVDNLQTAVSLMQAEMESALEVQDAQLSVSGSDPQATAEPPRHRAYTLEADLARMKILGKVGYLVDCRSKIVKCTYQLAVEGTYKMWLQGMC